MRIEVEGFSAYRDVETVDFEGVDFFSLTGPTGSGKSSLVDAMIFALYGRVPRLGGNAVAPVIAAGTDRARVRFFFEVDGLVYDATRLAQRTSSGGASVKEARLQEGDSVLADGPGDVTAQVENILHLGFDDFTRTVVLPQGDFARFLEATKSERQGLLRNLLGLDVYTRMRELARTRAAVASETADNARRALDALEAPDEETREASIAHRDALEELAEEIPEREDVLAALDRGVVETRQSATSIDDAITRLTAIQAPPKLEELETLSAEARSRVVETEEAVLAATEAVTRVEAQLATLPSPDQVAGWKKARGRLVELDQLLTEDDVEQTRKQLDDAESALADGLAAVASARKATADARAEHSAHLLAGSLQPGEPCPVCSQTVVEMPEMEELGVLADVEARESQTEAEVARLRTTVDEVRARIAGIEASHSRLNEQRAAIARDLEGAPEDLETTEIELQRRLEEIQRARAIVKDAGVEAKTAQKELESLADASRQVARTLTETQLSVAALGPPVSEADDVAVQWKELIVWRDQTIERLRGDQLEATVRVAEAETKASDARRELTSSLASHGIEAQEPFAVQVAIALQAARSLVESHEKAATRSLALDTEVGQATTRAAVAKTLTDHLKANGFEQWLMSGALGDLVTGANQLLAQLSDGGYSLHSDESGSFSIVDHRNADEMRRVETLSGGETFLVSLALALSLAETLSAKGGAGLDAIILDEGFGSLDDESLDTVAAVLEELTGKGLMVGVITHVKELAVRAHHQYEVTKGPAGAAVNRVTT